MIIRPPNSDPHVTPLPSGLGKGHASIDFNIVFARSPRPHGQCSNGRRFKADSIHYDGLVLEKRRVVAQIRIEVFIER
jgi:hypothetical protein